MNTEPALSFDPLAGREIMSLFQSCIALRIALSGAVYKEEDERGHHRLITAFRYTRAHDCFTF